MNGRLARATTLIGCVVALAACEGGAEPTPAAAAGGLPASSASGPSGVRGSVILSTCEADESDEDTPAEVLEPCLTPYAATLVLTQGGGSTVVARGASGPDGRFEFQVPPGEYIIVPANGDPFPQAQPVDVTVVTGAFAEVQVNYDNGDSAGP